MVKTAFYDQSAYDVRCEWGEEGVRHLAPVSDVVIIVDVMSFSTCVSVAASKGALVYPHKWRDETARERAALLGAVLAKVRAGGIYSVTSQTLLPLAEGMKILLPSLNGATLALMVKGVPTFAGCLRNASTVARAASPSGRRVTVIPAGERWDQGASLRPALEDLIGAGAIISRLAGSKSPEARTAEQTFRLFEGNLVSVLSSCSSGREIVDAGYANEIAKIAALDADDVAPRLSDGYFMAESPGPQGIQPSL